MENNNSFQISLYDKSKNIVGSQNVTVSNNHIFELKVQGESSNKIEIDAENKQLKLNNEKGEFDSISKEKSISIALSKITVDYNGNITFAMNTENGKETYKIDSNSVSKKESGTRDFLPVCIFEKPLDIGLPNNLPEQIEKNQLTMKEFPSQMFDMFQKSYNYKAYTSKDGKLKLLRSNKNELLVARGSKIIKVNSAEYFKNGEKSVLGLRLNNGKGQVNNQSTKGIGFKMSEEELKDVSSFIAGHKIKSTDYHKKDEMMSHTIDYSRTQKIKEAKKSVNNFAEILPNNTNVAPKTEGPQPEKPVEVEQPKETVQPIEQKQPTEPEQPTEKKQPVEPEQPLHIHSKEPKSEPEEPKTKPQEPKTEPEQPKTETEEPKKPEQPKPTASKTPKEDKPKEDKPKEDKKESAPSNQLNEKELAKKKATLNGFALLLFGLAAFFATGAAFLGAPVLGFVAMMFVFFSLSTKAYVSSDAVKTRFFEKRRKLERQSSLDKLLEKQSVKELSKRQQKKLNKLMQKEEQRQDKLYMNKPSYQPYKQAKEVAEQTAQAFNEDKYNYLKGLQNLISTRQNVVNTYNQNPNAINISMEEVNKLNEEIDVLKKFKNEIYNVMDTNRDTNQAIVSTLKMNFENNEFPSIDENDIVTTNFATIKDNYLSANNIKKPQLSDTLNKVMNLNQNIELSNQEELDNEKSF